MKKKRFTYDYDKKLDGIGRTDKRLKYKWKWGTMWYEPRCEKWAGGAHGQAAYAKINDEWTLESMRWGNDDCYKGMVERNGNWFPLHGEEKEFKSRIEAQIYIEELFKKYIKKQLKLVKG